MRSSFNALCALVLVSVLLLRQPEPTGATDDQDCEKHDGSCKDCVKESAQCYYCNVNDKCFYTKWSKLKPDPDRCSSELSDMNQLTCVLNRKVLYIVIGSVAGVVALIITICCCYCCCCRKGKKGMPSKDWLKWERHREARTAQREEQRRDRQERMDEIRRKYGIEERKY